MNDASRIALARRAAGRAMAIAADLDAIVGDTTVFGRMRDCQNGPGAQCLDAGPSGPHVADPTYIAAMRGTDGATEDIAELDRLLYRLAATAEKAQRIIDRYPPPRSATEADRLMLERLNGRGDDGCENCARIKGEGNGPRWEPAHPNLSGPTTVNNRLSEPKRLCVWCWDRVFLWGRLPSKNELEAHHRGKRVPWPKDVAQPKERDK